MPEPSSEGICPLVDGLHDDGAGADDPGCGAGAAAGVDQKVGAEATAAPGFVDGELPQQDDRDRVGHVAADPGRHPAALHGTGGKAVEPDHAVAIAGHIGASAALGLVEPRLALEPGVEGGDARREPRDVVSGRERLGRS